VAALEEHSGANDVDDGLQRRGGAAAPGAAVAARLVLSVVGLVADEAAARAAPERQVHAAGAGHGRDEPTSSDDVWRGRHICKVALARFGFDLAKASLEIRYRA
jgi:hypothetical protein